jgi:hypothetical protein
VNSMAAPATRLVARQSAGFRRRGRWQLEEDRMGDIRFPSRDQPPGASLGEPAEAGRKGMERREG